jgi:hypothetical protein
MLRTCLGYQKMQMIACLGPLPAKGFKFAALQTFFKILQYVDRKALRNQSGMVLVLWGCTRSLLSEDLPPGLLQNKLSFHDKLFGTSSMIGVAT